MHGSQIDIIELTFRGLGTGTTTMRAGFQALVRNVPVRPEKYEVSELHPYVEGDQKG